MVLNTLNCSSLVHFSILLICFCSYLIPRYSHELQKTLVIVKAKQLRMSAINRSRVQSPWPLGKMLISISVLIHSTLMTNLILPLLDIQSQTAPKSHWLVYFQSLATYIYGHSHFKTLILCLKLLPFSLGTTSSIFWQHSLLTMASQYLIKQQETFKDKGTMQVIQLTSQNTEQPS